MVGAKVADELKDIILGVKQFVMSTNQAAGTYFLKSRYSVTISYLLGLLLFFLPFAEIKCNDMPLGEMSGKNMMMGEVRTNEEMDSFGKGFDNTGEQKREMKDPDTVEFAVAAFVFGILGLIISLVAFRKPAISMIIGVITVICMIGLMIQVKANVNSQMESNDKMDLNMQITTSFTVWYYLSLLSFLAASYFSYRQKKLVEAGEVPPVNAPQLKVENPGSQSEFPTAPGESQVG
jgi:hypothetical protein